MVHSNMPDPPQNYVDMSVFEQMQASLDRVARHTAQLDAMLRMQREPTVRIPFSGQLVLPASQAVQTFVFGDGPSLGYRWLIRSLAVLPASFPYPATTPQFDAVFFIGQQSSQALGFQNAVAAISQGATYVPQAAFQFYSNEQIEVVPGDNLYVMVRNAVTSAAATVFVKADVLNLTARTSQSKLVA